MFVSKIFSYSSTLIKHTFQCLVVWKSIGANFNLKTVFTKLISQWMSALIKQTTKKQSILLYARFFFIFCVLYNFSPSFPLILGQGLCSTKQCGECVQPWPHHIQGPGGALWLHSWPPATDTAGHDCAGKEGGGCRQVCFCSFRLAG